MNRRQFLANVGMGAVASGPVLRAQTGQSATDTPDEVYQRAYAIDAMCFAAAPPRTYVQYLTDEKIAALRTSGITAMAMNMTANYAELSLADSLFAAVRDRINTWDRFIGDHSDIFVKVTTMAGLDAVKLSLIHI